MVKRPKFTVEKEIASLAPNGVSFAAMLLKPVPVIETGFKILPKLQTLLASENTEKAVVPEKIVTQRKYRSWARAWDYSDSESEDDECVDNSAW
jgi:hypothetical protein